MGILEQLENPAFKASKADKLLIAYIRKHAQIVSHTPIATLAVHSGVGESTITRFVKKMGYKNLQSFKLALTEEMTLSTRRYIINRNIVKDESAIVTARKLLDINIGTLEKTMELLDNDKIERTAQVMQAAERLHFIGLGNSGFIAQDSAYKFYRIGMECQGYDNSHRMVIMASLSKKEDVVVAISHSGTSPEILRTASLAKKNGASLIAITANPQAKLCNLADICILYEAQESLLETGSISAKMAQFFIMELIYTQVVKKMEDTAAENKQKTALAVNLLR
ncbi:MAG: MurR/RpiR family transcriptional regulator [Selenomonadaceae bacterium]